MGILLNPELESRIAAKVQSGKYRSADEVVEEGLALLDAREAAKEPADGAGIVQMISELSAQVPEQEWTRLPTDLSRNIDHYLYGSPRRPE